MLCISSDELRDILQAIAALEQSGVLVEVTTGTITDKIQKQESGFGGLLLGALAFAIPSIISAIARLGGIRAREGGIRVGEGGIRAGEGGSIRAGYR